MIFSFMKKIKNYFPKTIFVRFILIITIPLVLSQLTYIYVFFERYLDKSNRRTGELLLHEINIINNEFDKEYFQNIDEDLIVENLKNLSPFPVSFVKEDSVMFSNNLLKYDSKNFFNFKLESYIIELFYKLKNNDIFFIKNGKHSYDLYIKKHNGFLKIEISKDRAIPVSPKLLLFWTFLSTTVLITISCIFIKNQVKSIKNLTKAMTEFSLLDKDNEYFIPKGALEIREMGQAFLKMQNEIKKYVNSRTFMLAEISHDLRTPLTRINLEIEFIEDENIKNDIKKDIEEMQKMIDEYLMFAKGEDDDILEEVDISDFFNTIVKDYKRSGYSNILLETNIICNKIKIKKSLLKRAINNVVNNSLKYAKKIYIYVNSNKNSMHIALEDDGPGVSEEMYKNVTKPFFRINRNDKSANVGLGLAITKNIVYKHRGRVSFGKSQKLGGFRVDIDIPNNTFYS